MGWVARSIAQGHGFSSPFLPVTGPTALVPPLYPYLLAGIFKLFGLYTARAAFVALALNSLFSALTCIPLYFSAKQSLDARGGRLVAIAWAFYPFAVYFSADRIWDYALTGLLFSTCFCILQRLHLRGAAAWLGFGLLFGVCALSNPSIVSVLPVLFLIPVFKVRRVGGPWLRNSVIVACAFLAVCAPWAVRNHRALHSNAIFRDGFWLEFYAGNNGDTSESNSSWAHPASNSVEMEKYQRLGEVRYMEEKRVAAVTFVTHHPLFFVEVTARRVFRFWTGYWSFSRAYLKYEPLDVPNFFFCSALTFFLVRGLRRWWSADPGSVLPYLITIILFPFAYYLTHSSMDYRQPIEPVIVALVVVGIFGVEQRFPRRRAASIKPLALVKDASNDPEPIAV